MPSDEKRNGATRRQFLRLLMALLGALTAGRSGRRVASAAPAVSALSVRTVTAGDEAQLVEVMRACVASEQAFHGLCEGLRWTQGWAQEVVHKRPRSLVALVGGEIVAYCDAPSAPPRISGEPMVDRYGKAYWCAAAGVREDLLGKAQAEMVFRELVRRSFEEARKLGYEFVRAAAPFAKHPHFSKPFADYPGMEVTAYQDADGNTRYLLVWQLDQAIAALAEEEGALGRLS